MPWSWGRKEDHDDGGAGQPLSNLDSSSRLLLLAAGAGFADSSRCKMHCCGQALIAQKLKSLGASAGAGLGGGKRKRKTTTP